MEIPTNNMPIDDVSRPDATGRDTEQYTVSVPEAAELFTASGLPRTERAIQRFCKKGDLICAFQDTAYGSRYLIKRTSIDRLIQQKLQALAVAPDTDGRDVSRPDATGRDTSRQDNDAPKFAETPPRQRESNATAEGHDIQQYADSAGHSDAEFKRLKEENLELKIDNSARQQFINLLTGEVEKTRIQVQELSYQLGVAHTRVAQLEAPTPRTDTLAEMSRPVATTDAEKTLVPNSVGEGRGNADEQPLASVPIVVPDAPKLSLYRRIFG